MSDIKQIVASLDTIASQLQTKGLVKLATQVDLVNNTLEVLAAEEVEAAKDAEAGALGTAVSTALLALGLITHGKANDMDKAVGMINKMPAAEKTKLVNDFKKELPALQEVIKTKTENAIKPIEMTLKGPGGPAEGEIEEHATKKVEQQAPVKKDRVVHVTPAA